MTADDNHIYKTMQEDTEKGFRLIVAKFGEPIYWHIRRLLVSHDDTQDAEQETLVKVFRSFSSLKDPNALTAWIYRIATNEAMRILEKEKKPRMLTDSIDGNTAALAANRMTADQYTDYSDLEAVKLQKAILSLPPKQQLAFNLRYYDDMSYSQIGEIAGGTATTAKVNYHLAKEKIVKYMESND